MTYEIKHEPTLEEMLVEHKALGERIEAERAARGHVLLKCSNGHKNWMERSDLQSWKIQTAYCSTCGAPLYAENEVKATA